MEYLPQWLLNTNILVSIFGWLYESNCLHTCVSIGIMQALVRYPSFSLMGTAKHPTASTFLHLPDALVKSIAEYVCEVWSHTYVNLYQLVMLLCTETWVGVPKRKITTVKHWHIPTLPYIWGTSAQCHWTAPSVTQFVKKIVDDQAFSIFCMAQCRQHATWSFPKWPFVKEFQKQWWISR